MICNNSRGACETKHKGANMWLRSVSRLAILLALPAASAAAADSSAGAGAAVATGSADDQGLPIVITGQREEYGARSTRSATRTDTDIRNVPQAITVISESQIEDQSL